MQYKYDLQKLQKGGFKNEGISNKKKTLIYSLGSVVVIISKQDQILDVTTGLDK